MEAVIFDYDGTLVQPNIDFGVIRRDVEALVSQSGLDPLRFDAYFILEMIDEASRIIQRLSPTKAKNFHADSLDLVKGHEVRAAQRGRVLPGIIPMLERLKSLDIGVGIVTRNCKEAVHTLFPRIESFCDVFVSRDRMIRVKPHPDHLSLVLDRLEVRHASRCYMVGDHVSDIEAGKRVHMKTAGVLTGNETRENFVRAGADLILDDATEILDYLPKIK